jgi:Carbamoylphosphate synthase large subunit (split gene in MJ)
VAVKAPRFDFAKFGVTDPTLGTEMRAVGESLGLGRTFAEAFLKALDGREQAAAELDLSRRGEPVPERWDLLLESARRGLDLPGIHPYFADELRAISAAESELAAGGDIAAAKRFGLPDRRWPASSRSTKRGATPARTTRSPGGRLVCGGVRGEDAVLLPLL